VALQLQRLLRQFGRPGDKPSAGWQIDLTLTQGDLASLLGASRQRINGVLRQLQAEGILGSSHGRIEVLQPRQLVDVAQGRRLLDTAGV
jgi:CRP-like cAMP-binding protein